MRRMALPTRLLILAIALAACSSSAPAERPGPTITPDAAASGITADAAYKDITSNLIGHGRLVPAGIVAVNRAQEHGYSIT